MKNWGQKLFLMLSKFNLASPDNSYDIDLLILMI